MTNFTPDQFVAFTVHTPMVSGIEAVLPNALAHELHNFGVRVGNAYHGYVPTQHEQEHWGISPVLPTQEEAKELFGRVYLALDYEEDRSKFRLLMKAMDMELPPRTEPGGGKRQGL